ncbi:MAG: RNA polymerase sigma factor [Candidatus Zixiibacteriota bacterium]|nr:MAG: RNA polymerase sigma factor [candidate division Zixibacteria bacterium]
MPEPQLQTSEPFLPTNNHRFWELLEPEHARAEAFCRQLVGNRDEADDLYQDGLLAAMRKFHTLKDPGYFRTWLYRILINRYRNRFRQPWWRRRVPLTSQSESVEAGADPTALHTARRWLNRAMAVLAVDERALVSLYELEGWSIGDLSAMYRRPPGTIKARLARSRRKMRREIERYLARHEETQTNGAAHAFSQSQPSPD